MNELDACRPSVRGRCPIDVAVLSRWFLDDADSMDAECEEALADTLPAEEVAA